MISAVTIAVALAGQAPDAQPQEVVVVLRSARQQQIIQQAEAEIEWETKHPAEARARRERMKQEDEARRLRYEAKRLQIEREERAKRLAAMGYTYHRKHPKRARTPHNQLVEVK